MITFIYERCPDAVKEWLDERRKEQNWCEHKHQVQLGRTIECLDCQETWEEPQI